MEISEKKGETWCAAKGCKNNSNLNSDLTFFDFPKDEQWSKIWAKKCRRKDLIKKGFLNCRICSVHFENDMFLNELKNELKSRAVPTIFHLKKTEVNDKKKQLIEGEIVGSHLEETKNHQQKSFNFDFNCDDTVTGDIKIKDEGDTNVIFIKQEFNGDEDNVNVISGHETSKMTAEEQKGNHDENVKFIMQQYENHSFEVGDTVALPVECSIEVEEKNITEDYKKPDSDVDNTDSDDDDEVIKNMNMEATEHHVVEIDTSSFIGENYVDNVDFSLGYVNWNTNTKNEGKNKVIQQETSGKKSYKCNVCDKLFTRADVLKKHTLLHTGEKPYQCDVCNKRFAQLYTLNCHKRIHTSEKSYQCDVCNKCFIDLASCKRHEIMHTGDKPYECDVCNKRFAQSYKLNCHKLAHTGLKPYQCDVCDKCFTDPAACRRHRVVHTGEKPYECDVCNKKFTHANNLYTHKHIHSGEKPYQCEVCNKCFTDPTSFRRHKLVHTGEKPYQCDICNKCFNRLHNLKKHKLVHTGEKPYQCDICNRFFNCSSNLKKHKVGHTVGKPFHCEICKKGFGRMDSLKSHHLLHTGAKPFKCELCNKTFTKSHVLKRHQLLHITKKSKLK